MPDHHPYGKPISILKFSNTKEVIIDHEELDKIFDHPEIQDRKVITLSLIGAFRGGKSFFLNYCLRFLYAHMMTGCLGSKYEPLNGFSWRSGKKRDTTGIIMWSDVFLHTIETTGTKIAIFVMDSQGLFDSESDEESNSKIFALGTLIPSIQILNMKAIIQKNQLEYLQFATEYTKKSVTGIMNEDSFQSLMFLMRDWSNKDEYAYGIDGGNEYLKELLKFRENESEKLLSVRKSISKCFKRFQCCLLPYPGEAVTSNSKYDGRLSRMKVEFRNELKELIESILLPSKLIIKEVNSKEVTVEEMKKFIQAYFEKLQSDKKFKVLNYYESTVEVNMNITIEKCFNDYKMRMFENKDLLIDNVKHKVHDSCKKEALKLYEEERKLGSIEYVQLHKTILSKKIDKIYDNIENVMERERAKFEDALEKEQRKKKELEQIIEYIDTIIEEMSKNKTIEGFTEIMNVLKIRQNEEVKKLKEMLKKEKEKKEFRKVLQNAIITTAFGLIIGWFSNNIKPSDALNYITGKARNILTMLTASKTVQTAVNVAESNIVENATVALAAPIALAAAPVPVEIEIDPKLVGATILSIAVNGIALTTVALIAAYALSQAYKNPKSN